MTTVGRYPGVSPSSEFFPLSGATASSPVIAITATTATGGGTVIHTGDLQAQDIPLIYIANNSGAAMTGYLLMGTTATTSVIPTAVNAGAWTLAIPAGTISKSGVIGMFTTATTGLVVWGSIQRCYTSTG